jgi:hypothetical protein
MDVSSNTELPAIYQALEHGERPHCGRAGRGYDGRHGAGSEDEPMPVDLVKPSSLLSARLGSNGHGSC